MQQVPLKSEPPFQRTYAPTLRFMPTELRQTAPERNKGKAPKLRSCGGKDK